MVEIKRNLVSSSKYSIKCPYSMTPEYITVHNTANDASAVNEVNYMSSNNNQVSYHYAVDDIQIVQGIPTNRNSWNAGDGGNGTGNRKSIAIEICYSKSGGDRFIQAEKNASEFIASILKEKGWGIDRVKKHQDWSNKYCPHRTLDMGWERFINMINSHLNGSTPAPAPQVNNGLPNLSGYTGNSIVDGLKSVGYDSSFASRKDLANKVGISNYSGTASQNTKLLNALRGNTSAPVPQPSVSYYSCNYNGTSFVDALKSIGVDSSFNNRKVIASKNGITNYVGEANQNIELLSKLKSGKLIK